MATVRLIYEQIKLLNEVYQRGISEPSMQAMSLVWERDLCDLSDGQFVAALAGHRKASRYWPTPADILAAHANATPNRPPVTALEERRPENDAKTFAANAAMLVASLRGNDKAKAYFATADQGEKDALAAVVLGRDGRRHNHARRFAL